MPISIRVPADIESQITGFGLRAGLSKSAVIVRSIQEFLAKNAAPSSLQIYEEAMLSADLSNGKADLARAALDKRSSKLDARQALRRKHAERSARAKGALATKAAFAAKSP